MLIGTGFAKALTHGNKVYVCGGACKERVSQQIVQEYNILKKKWSKLPLLSHTLSAVAIIDKQLTLIGGRDIRGTLTRKLLTWTGKVWLELYPPMHTARYYPGVLAIEHFVIVSGGKGAERSSRSVDTLEFLDIKNKKWIQSNLKLPRPLALHQMALCGDYIYIYFNVYFYRMNKMDFMASLTSLKPVAQEWERLENAPKSSSLLSLSMQPVLVGPSGIFTYDTKWTRISEVTSFGNACSASLNEKTFLTFGGKGEGEYQTSAVQYNIVVEVSILIFIHYIHYIHYFKLTFIECFACTLYMIPNIYIHWKVLFSTCVLIVHKPCVCVNKICLLKIKVVISVLPRHFQFSWPLCLHLGLYIIRYTFI